MAGIFKGQELELCLEFPSNVRKTKADLKEELLNILKNLENQASLCYSSSQEESTKYKFLKQK